MEMKNPSTGVHKIYTHLVYLTILQHIFAFIGG